MNNGDRIELIEYERGGGKVEVLVRIEQFDMGEVSHFLRNYLIVGN